MNTNSPRPITHWLFQRSTAILIIFTVVLAPFWLLFPALSIFIFFHLYLGLEEILADYVHNEVIGNLFLKLLQIFMLISIKFVMVLLVF